MTPNFYDFACLYCCHPLTCHVQARLLMMQKDPNTSILEAYQRSSIYLSIKTLCTRAIYICICKENITSPADSDLWLFSINSSRQKGSPTGHAKQVPLVFLSLPKKTKKRNPASPPLPTPSSGRSHFKSFGRPGLCEEGAHFRTESFHGLDRQSPAFL